MATVGAVATPEPFYSDREQIAIDLPGTRVVFTTRRGGVSQGSYASLNLGFLTDDDPAAVASNRRRLETDYGVELAWGRQVHGARVEIREAGNDSLGIGPGEAAEADGQATAAPGVAPMVLTADCLGIAIAGGGAVAVVHAGWRGLAEGVIEHGIRAVRELCDSPTGGRSEPLSAAIGPAAGACCYEVGEEVHAQFADLGSGIRRGRNLDMSAIATLQLRAAGVAEVHDVGLCTICSEPSLFYSHRREHGLTGRQAAIAWLS